MAKKSTKQAKQSKQVFSVRIYAVPWDDTGKSLDACASIEDLADYTDGLEVGIYELVEVKKIHTPETPKVELI